MQTLSKYLPHKVSRSKINVIEQASGVISTPVLPVSKGLLTIDIMSIPNPVDHERFQFLTRDKQVVTSSKIIELKPQKQENTAYYVTCLLAAETIIMWLKPNQPPLSLQQVLKLLGLNSEEEEADGINLLRFLEKEKSKKYNSFAKFGEQLDLIAALKEADSRSVGSVYDELTLRLEKIFTNYPVDLEDEEEVKEFFDFSENYLKQWYFTEPKRTRFRSCSVVLKGNSVGLQNRLYSRYESIYHYVVNQSSLTGVIALLQGLSQATQGFQQEFEQKKERNIDKENGSLRTYKRTLSRLKDLQKNRVPDRSILSKAKIQNALANLLKSPSLRVVDEELEEMNEKFEIAKRALLDVYRLKIEAEGYALGIQVLRKTESTNQIYLGILQDSDRFLTELKEQFLSESRIETNLLPFMLNNVGDYLDPAKLQKRVESKVGHTLPSWGRYKGVTKDMVREALLEELEPIAQKICDDTQNKLNQESKLT